MLRQAQHERLWIHSTVSIQLWTDYYVHFQLAIIKSCQILFLLTCGISGSEGGALPWGDDTGGGPCSLL